MGGAAGAHVNMLSGIRALTDYHKKQERARAIGNILCEQEEKLVDAVEHLRQESIRQKGEIITLRRRIMKKRAEETDVSAEVVTVFDEELSGEEAREYMNLLLERGAKVCAVFAGKEETGYRYVIGSKAEDVRPLNQRLKEKFGARGGGKPEMVQGSLTGARDQIKALL